MGTLDSSDFAGSSLGSQHTEDPCARAHIWHHLVLEEVQVVKHGVSVPAGVGLIFQHLVNAKASIGMK